MGAFYNKSMSSLCNTCGMPLMGCGHCGQCQPKCGCEDKCQKPCGCPESILSIEADSTDPAYLRFNLGGRSVWYDFTSVVKAAETCTHLSTDLPSRSLIYDSECGRQTITARQLGSVLHLADIGDVDESTIKDNAVLVYRKDADCGENCDGKNGWIGVDLTEEGDEEIDYIMGSDEDGKIKSLMPPADTGKTHYLTWEANGKAHWAQIKPAIAPPVDPVTNTVCPVYFDPNTGELVYVMKEAS